MSPAREGGCSSGRGWSCSEERKCWGMARRLFSVPRSQSTYWPGGGNAESLPLGGFFIAWFHPLGWSPDALAPGALSLFYPTSFSVPHHITSHWGSHPAPVLCQVLSFLGSLGTEQVYPSWPSFLGSMKSCFLLECLGMCVPKTLPFLAVEPRG